MGDHRKTRKDRKDRKEPKMNPLIHTLATTIAKERTMTSTTANDRREGFWQRVINWMRACLS